MWRSLGLLIAFVLASTVGETAVGQIIRTAPDLKPPPGYQPGTGVNRNGIMTRPNTRRTTNYVVPGGSYYYGWSPGRYYYRGDSYYYTERYFCPYCGGRGCSGACRYRQPVYLPPVTADAGTLFGPRAVRDFIGVNNNNQNAGGANPIRVAAAEAPLPPPPMSNPTARAQAWKFVDIGDRHFKRGDYRKAAKSYRKAESRAKDLADVYFRQGFAEAGVARYTEAVAAMQKGLRFKPDWPSSGFVLEELYPTDEAKRAVFRELHTYVNEHPNNADAQYVLAVMQHFDGQSEAAEVRFRRVVELTGTGLHARAFLPAPAQEPAPEEVDE